MSNTYTDHATNYIPNPFRSVFIPTALLSIIDYFEELILCGPSMLLFITFLEIPSYIIIFDLLFCLVIAVILTQILVHNLLSYCEY